MKLTTKFADPLLAAIAGYVDTLSFVALFGLFTAHVTGNFVLIGAALAGYGKGIFLKLVVFPAFVAGVAASSMLVRALPASLAPHGARILYAMQALLMLAFCGAGVLATPVTSSDDGWVFAAGILGTFAMGVQNAHARVIQRPGVPTTVMTGNVTQAILDAVDMRSTRADEATRQAARQRFGKMMPAMLAFAGGAMAGALAYRGAGFWALLMPCAALALLAWKTAPAPPRGPESGQG
jgi:uncharacterized membrane protein YoaK (UPF0700 family)